ncbi:MAG TPA: VWA domain-containing protein [Acidisarcina sp.]
MSLSSRRWPALLVGAAALFCARPSAAQRVGETEPPAPKLVVNVNRLLIPVVVRDGQGRVVSDLKKEDFSVLDEGKPRAISGFAVEKRGSVGSASRSDGGAAPRADASGIPQRIVVFLFDDLHLDIEELARAKAAAIKAVPAVVSDSAMAAVVSTSGKVNSGLTRDAAKLQATIKGMIPRGAVGAGSNDCPTLDYYQADLILNKHDTLALQDGMSQMLRCDPKMIPSLAQSMVESAARRVLAAGQQDVQGTDYAVAEYVRRIANMPGQRTLILVSSGYLNIEQESLSVESRIIDFATRANVTISALDARGLYSTEIPAGENTSGREVRQIAEYKRSSMSQAEGPMSEFADGTGGSFFHNSNDLEAGFKDLAVAPECVYVLEVALDNAKPDGRYHRLEVKVDRGGSVVTARRGYLLMAGKK